MMYPRYAKPLLLLAALSLPLELYAAPPTQFEIDLKELDRQKEAAPKKPAPQKPARKQPPKKKETVDKKESAPAPARAAKAPPAAPEGDFVRYTVRPGDHIFKILMVHFGMSNDEAERLIPEIVRINEVGNIKKLQVGRTLLIPSKVKAEGVEGKADRKAEGKTERKAEGKAAPEKGVEPRTAGKKKSRRARGAEPVEAVAAPKAPEAAPRAPEPAPAPAPAPVTAPAPVPPPPPAPVPVPKPAPAPAPAPAAQTPAPPAAAPPAAPVANTWVCTVPQQDVTRMVDSVLNAISASWSKNRIVESDKGFANPFSIRVDRYFEYKGSRYIVSIGENDPYSYTLLRLLETAGYRVLTLGGKEDFKGVSEKLFRLVGVAPNFGSHQLEGGKEAAGYLLQQDDAGGRRVLVTDRTAPAGHKWVLPAGCGAK